jgi:ABC-2 type transport system permease protein
MGAPLVPLAMSTARCIARHEIRLAWRDGRFLAAAGVVLLLLSIALAAGVGRYRDVRSQRDAATRDTYAQWLAQPAKNPHSAAHYGMYAFKPTFVTSLIDPGVDAFAGVASFLEAHKQNEFSFRPAQDAGGAARFGDLSVAMVLQVLLPLLMITLAFGAIAGEREAGTLRQLIGGGLSRGTLVFGKVLGIGGAVGLVLLPAVVMGVIALVAGRRDGEFATSLPRLAGLAGSYLAYFIVWLLIALAVSAWARTARSALVVLLGCWGLGTLVLPRLAVDVARARHPTPSSLELEQRIASDIAADPEFAQRTERRVLAQYGVSRVEDLPVSLAGLQLAAGEANSTEIYERRLNEIRDAFERQNRLQGALGALNPLFALRATSMALAGTDYAHLRHFAAAAERYRQLFVTMMNDDMTTHGRGRDYAYVAAADLWARVPAFDYTPPRAAEVFRSQALNLAVLVGWLGVAGAALWLAARRLTIG